MALNLWVPPSWLKIDFMSIFSPFFIFKAILGHEFRATAQNKALQIRFPLTSTEKWPELLVEFLTLSYDPMGNSHCLSRLKCVKLFSQALQFMS